VTVEPDRAGAAAHAGVGQRGQGHGAATAIALQPNAPPDEAGLGTRTLDGEIPSSAATVSWTALIALAASHTGVSWVAVPQPPCVVSISIGVVVVGGEPERRVDADLRPPRARRRCPRWARGGPPGQQGRRRILSGVVRISAALVLIVVTGRASAM